MNISTASIILDWLVKNNSVAVPWTLYECEANNIPEPAATMFSQAVNESYSKERVCRDLGTACALYWSVVYVSIGGHEIKMLC